MNPAWALCACLIFSGCRSAGQLAGPVKLQHLPPTPKDLISAAMESSQTPLSDSSCVGYGTDPADKTIGRYLAGYLVELSNQDARNAVSTSVEPRMEGGQSVYVCRVMIRHAEKEDVWRWGVQFTARQSDGLVLSKSFQCVGAG